MRFNLTFSPIMKNLLYFCLLSIFLSVLPSCSRSQKEWPHISAEFDAINRQLDTLYFQDKLTIQGPALINSLEALAPKISSDYAKACVLYWKGVANMKISAQASHKYLDSARALIDSSAVPYFCARIDATDRFFTPASYLNRYSRISSAIEYFIKCGDKQMQLMARRSRSHYFLELSDFKHYHDEITEIDRLCNECAWDSLTLRNQLNFALYYIQVGDKAHATAILDSLKNNSSLQRDSSFLSRIYIDLAMLNQEPKYIQKALRLIPNISRKEDDVLTLRFSMAQMYEARGDYAQADSLLLPLIPIIEKDGDASAKAVLHRIFSERKERAGDFKGALYEHRESERWEQALYSPHNHAALSEFNLHDTLERIEKENAQERLLQTSKWVILLLIVLCVVVIVVYIFRSRNARLKLEKSRTDALNVELELDLERKRRSIVAMGIAVNETDALSKHLINKVEGMHQQGSISVGARNELSQMVKQSAAGRKELHDLRSAHEDLHPDFLHRLSEKYPTLSPTEKKLALYISIGLGTKQIAQLMHIQPDSVKKSRQRLRRRMEITPEQSLEQILADLL